ncbi:LysM peptidoglycan-binding domain-containing M23 family metallopeptidase [Rhodobacter capsulatus]|uniref:LysM peptidoglycan-binding domain-containing M23 family metallopeptidase n=1 Tax=Rhodobacter capsulatus TaxID=1061 RepID=UPI000DAEDA73|nr:LysM peptidoglycan-binding domain-containing M23 family metallopeptidase [Rhodobacter capsulatus]PZX26435.1 murein DD-endopeptidase MepM/ murein hydrolase activator NlpD [Rhodobacter capsulatus]QNR61923.1 LysM peptidoglycan-binding domain-containing M23 family metallopeptidase [Rhodobacter capsulatus]
MQAPHSRRLTRVLLTGVALAVLAGCGKDGRFDADLRHFGKTGFDTTEAVRQATADRPAPDARGVISYPNYQVAVARQGDSVGSIASRLGLDAAELARYNALAPNTPLGKGEVLALPKRVGEPAPGAVAGGAAAAGSERIDITSLAGAAIDRAAVNQPPAAAPAAPAAAPRPAAPSASPVAKPAARQTGAEPIRHRVARGETAYSIARYYNVPAKSVADWNGLPADLSVREGQMLMIPPATGAAPRPATAALTEPGEGSPTPEPPSAAKPLPKEVPPKASAPVDTSAAPDLGAARTEASRSSKFVMPVPGAIIRPYAKGKNDGVDIRAAAGTAVKAADAGTVAAITKDTEQVPILVLRHEGGLLTVYANIDGITVAKGDKVRRGQSIAKVRAGDTGFLHFEVRKGYDSVDPMPYLD